MCAYGSAIVHGERPKKDANSRDRAMKVCADKGTAQQRPEGRDSHLAICRKGRSEGAV